ncbi:hypothetical protein [Argonema galeatum]|uniref:hypothetical protein n=1 Tax=Argonema galeatum TaxID=2942762 RepID=UPI0020139CBB|nr:hypothetical protein [Argonema galeatum]MCL1465358.1 hypothetical protein [Argonema galeatum A003/A1]
MPNPIFNQPLDRKVPTCESPAIQEIHQRLASLKKSHSMLYRMMNLETWAIVGTMEDFDPGFWNRFMTNRQLAFKDFLAQKKAKRS